jgi:hypothetical protein
MSNGYLELREFYSPVQPGGSIRPPEIMLLLDPYPEMWSIFVKINGIEALFIAALC